MRTAMRRARPPRKERMKHEIPVDPPDAGGPAVPGPHRLRRRRGGGPDPETAAQALLDSGAFSDALDTVDQDTAAALYGIDADTITGSAVYTSLSAGAEEIAVLVLTDEDAAAAALDGLEARVADQKAVLESYQPDEVSKLDSAIVEQRGNSVLLAVAADAEKARAALDGLE